MNLTIQNTGDDTLKIIDFTSLDTLFRSGINLPAQINPSQQLVAPTYFHSGKGGSFTGKFTIRSNDPDEDPFYVSTSASAYSPNIMKLENATAVTGGVAEIFVSIENNDPFSAFQLDINFPSGLTIILDSTKLTNRSQDHALNKGFVSGNKYRFFAYSPTKKDFFQNDGSVLRILCTVSGGVGSYPLQIQNPIIGNEQGENLLSSSVNGTLTVGNPVLVKSKIWLEGPYQTGGSMATILRSDGVMPKTSPYSDERIVESIPLDITDWVCIELRSSSSGPAVVKRSFFVRNDGYIVDENGTTALNNAGSCWRRVLPCYPAPQSPCCNERQSGFIKQQYRHIL